MRPSPPPCRFLPGRVPVVEGGGGEDDGELVGPLGGVAPALLLGVPEVALRGEAHDALGEAAPHREGKVHLVRDGGCCHPAVGTCGRGVTIAPGRGGYGVTTQHPSRLGSGFAPAPWGRGPRRPRPHLAGREAGVFIQAQDGVRLDGRVGEESVAELQGGKNQVEMCHGVDGPAPCPHSRLLSPSPCPG